MVAITLARAMGSKKKSAQKASKQGRAELVHASEEPAQGVVVRSNEALVAEAIRRGREVVSQAEGALASYGEWLFANLFEGDSRAVLDRDLDDPAWVALMHSANSATFPMSRATLSTTLRVAAYDKRLADAAWQRLSFSHKAALLPLADPKTMRTAARHVLAASLSVRATNEYIANLRFPDGRTPRLTPSGARKTITRLAEPFSQAKYLAQLESQLARLDESERTHVARELETLVEQLGHVLAALKKHPPRRSPRSDV